MIEIGLDGHDDKRFGICWINVDVERADDRIRLRTYEAVLRITDYLMVASETAVSTK